jgi:hypothetical protein
MKTKLLGIIAAVMLLITARSANAAILDIDLNLPGGVPGTGGSTFFAGPCYCDTTIYYSPVFLVQAGETVDFGRVSLYSFEGGVGPDTASYYLSMGLNPPNLYLLYGGVGVAINPPVVPAYLEMNYLSAPYPNLTYFTSCDPTDLSCNYAAGNMSVTNNLTYTIPNGAESIQLAWAGAYSYEPPAPLPAALPLFATGLGALGLFGWRRKRKVTAAIAST